MSNELRISQITLKNYRQYYGEVKINFAPKENVFSIIIGTNGTGKSNLWNAIHWCLFGVEPHIKGPNIPPIINKKYLQEKNSGLHETYVELIMIFDEHKYRIKRSLEGSLHKLDKDENGMIIMSKQDPVPSGFEIMNTDKSELFQISTDGGPWETKNDKYAFKNLVAEHIIPENLSKFFILDGEFLQDLFDEFENIENGINQISQINMLTKTIEYSRCVRLLIPTTGGTEDELIKTISKCERILESEDKMGQKLISKTKFVHGTDDHMHESGNPRKKDLETAIHNITAELRDLNAKINRSNADLKLKSKTEYTKMKETKESLESELEKDIEEHLNHLIQDGPLFMCKKSLKLSSELITKEMDIGKLPNTSKRIMIDGLLAKNLCVCGTSLEPGTETRELVESEMGKISGDEKYDIADYIKQDNDRFLNNYKKTLSKLNYEMKSIQKQKYNLDNMREKLKILERQLPSDDEEYALWISQQKDLNIEKDDLNKELGRTEVNIANLTTKRADAMRGLSAYKMKKGERKNAIILKKKSEDVIEKLVSIKQIIDEKIRKDVADETLRIYNNMTWKENFKQLLINDKYRISITGDDGTDIAGGMAAGEKLFLALSFIMALKKITRYKFPFIIDSPLGRTGNNLRRRFGENIPDLLDGSQMIMLVTDSEYNDEKIQSDGKNKAYTMRELLEQKGSVHEYNIDFDKTEETAKIVGSQS